jgi:hypothetical protein
MGLEVWLIRSPAKSPGCWVDDGHCRVPLSLFRRAGEARPVYSWGHVLREGTVTLARHILRVSGVSEPLATMLAHRFAMSELVPLQSNISLFRVGWVKAWVELRLHESITGGIAPVPCAGGDQ